MEPTKTTCRQQLAWLTEPLLLSCLANRAPSVNSHLHSRSILPVIFRPPRRAEYCCERLEDAPRGGFHALLRARHKAVTCSIPGSMTGVGPGTRSALSPVGVAGKIADISPSVRPRQGRFPRARDS